VTFNQSINTVKESERWGERNIWSCENSWA